MHKKRFLIYPLLAGVVSGTVLPIFAQDGHVSPTAPDNKSDITVVGRKNGSFEQDVFFAGKDASYELQVSSLRHGENRESIIVEIGDERQEVSVSGGRAEFPIEPGREGYMKILDGDGDEEDEEGELADYIIAEEIPPVISCAKLERSNSEEMVVSFRDEGEIVSGIQSYEVLLDGAALENCTEVKTEKVLQNGASIYNKVELTIPIGGRDGHELSVTVKDQCGNLAEKIIELGEEDEDVSREKEKKEEISVDDQQDLSDDVLVIVPTDITMKLFTGPNMVEGNIQSQDIMVINKSEFPVRVTASKIRYGVKDGHKEIPCELSARVRQYKKGEQVYDLRKKDNAPFSLELAAGRKKTDAQGLLNEAAKWNPTGSVESPDYGVLRLEGTAAQSGKASVGIVFEFEKMDDRQ